MLSIVAAKNCSSKTVQKMWIENMLVMMFTESYLSEFMPSEKGSVSVWPKLTSSIQYPNRSKVTTMMRISYRVSVFDGIAMLKTGR